MKTAVKQVQKIFKRTEKKYLLTREQYSVIHEVLSKRMEPDMYAEYSICNIYYDTRDFSLIRTSIEKPIYKEKIRLRSYGVPGDYDKVFLEIKKKSQGIVGKRRIILSLQEAEQYLNKGIYPDSLDCQILHEIDFAKDRYQVVPAAYISYDREALSGLEDKNLRITFDQNILCRKEDLHLNSKRYGVPILEENQILMEIKIPGSMPIWLARLLSELKIFPTSFSKYGTYYQQHLLSECFLFLPKSAQRVTNVNNVSRGGVRYNA
ncbi:polyphosphate polymerase domain-containing protein [Blautia liquoris]|jgi:uncharacterized protein YjbK|uniref:Polyphosphate polymerase domain-containing protein n=1 Tax=Blautia liquoris TaxID=2779518 RepID=A0A7M2RDD1_9FIRM|nr:polyphosphate polymerase domain-containing protein [Blautia liquoris]QOV18158.1 polyphosphate polymerase domain-containing protein [Blautia liquoris]